MTLPIYRGAAERLPQDHRRGHVGLRFHRLFDRYEADWSIGDNSKKDWLETFAHPVGDADTLAAHAAAQRRLIESLGGRSALLTTRGPLVTGTGYPHPVENGLAWHPVLGTPYLAGSGVKGLLRAWAEQWLFGDDAQRERRDLLLHWFGSDAKHFCDQKTPPRAGGLILFDAVPVEPVRLELGIMTPHGGKWYERGGRIGDPSQHPEAVPADWHDPTPIPYLVVGQARLLFGLAPRSPWSGDIDLNQAMTCLTDALDWLGAGAKTAVGHGRMEPDAAADAHLDDLIRQQDADDANADASPEQREINALRALLEQERAAGRKDAGGPLMQGISRLLKEAIGWPQAEREAAAQLAADAYGYVGWGKPARKKERKAAIAALGGGGA
jgi:CRISPR-associated protein Cmr6